MARPRKYSHVKTFVLAFAAEGGRAVARGVAHARLNAAFETRTDRIGAALRCRYMVTQCDGSRS
jgi:hypothetical protein